MFPTALAAIGCQIDGNRLGLGTNLFSSLETLAEKYGLEDLNKELAKHSDYYNKNFIKSNSSEIFRRIFKQTYCQIKRTN